MTTKPQEHFPTPSTVPPVYRHSSESVRSQNSAGGKVQRGQYEGTAPKHEDPHRPTSEAK